LAGQRTAAVKEIGRMRSAGIDGVLFDMLPRVSFDPSLFDPQDWSTHPTENFALFHEWLEAARSVSANFKVGLFLDVKQASAENPRGEVPTAERWAQIINTLVATYGSHPNVLRIHNKVAVFHFGTHTPLRGASGWSGGWDAVFESLRKSRSNIYFVADVRPAGEDNVARWLGVSDAVHLFAPGAPISFGTAYQATLARNATRLGKDLVWSVAMGYYVPEKWYGPPLFERYDHLWRSAIAARVDTVQILTWNDVAEATDIWKSDLNSDIRLKLTRFYADAFRKGAIEAPTDTRIYVACPVQIHNKATATVPAWPRWKSDKRSIDACFYWGTSGIGDIAISIEGVGSANIGPGISMGELGTIKAPGPLWLRARTRTGEVFRKQTRAIQSGASSRENLHYFYEEIRVTE
jgi:hypothetical protein